MHSLKLVISVLTEIVEYGLKVEEKVKAMLSEIKENVQETNSVRKETGTQINDLEWKEENGETRIQKNEERLRNLWDNFKRSNIWIITVPEGEEEEQKIEKLIWTNNEGGLPQSGQGNGLPGSPGSPESPKQVGPKEAHNKTS